MAGLSHVKPGDSIADITAGDYNAFVDAARAQRGREVSFGAGGRGGRFEPGIILVRNESGEDQPRFAVMRASSAIIQPADNADEFKARPASGVYAPAVGDSTYFVILRQPLAAGEMGDAVIAGTSPVQINVVDESHTAAHPVIGETDYLESGSGVARILWKETGTGVKWALIQFPVGGTGGGMKVAKITGKAGTAPPYLYTGVEVEHDGTSAFAPANFNEASSGDDLAWKLVNAQEIGTGAAGVGPLELDSIVLYTPAGDYFLCTASQYKGTY